MILETGTMRLAGIRWVRRGVRADILVCVRADCQDNHYYTVWVIRDPGMARSILEDFWQWQKERPETEAPCLACFFQGPRMCFLFPYFQERPLSRFYRREIWNADIRQKIRLGLIAECMASGLPDSLLYLFLVQDQIRLEADGSVHMQYTPDLDDYDPRRGRRDCCEACADKILSMLEEEGKAGLCCRMLVRRRLERGRYSELDQLYQDVRIAGSRPPAAGIRKRALTVFGRHRGSLTRIVMACCLLLMGAAVLMAVSWIIWGAIPLLRLFTHSFQTRSCWRLMRIWCRQSMTRRVR